MSQDPSDALARLLGSVTPVDVQTSSIGGPLAGRVLAEEVLLDRDSPACDVSAMDGFAVRLSDIARGPVPLLGECRIGEAPRELPPGAAMRAYTGSPLPTGADAVLRVERARATDTTLALDEGAEPPEPGADIRRRGENARAGAKVLPAGVELTAAAMTAVATVGPPSVEVFRPLRVAVLTTGDELEPAHTTPAEPLPPWRLRDSNGPALIAMLSPLPWIETVQHGHAEDTLQALVDRLAEAIDWADAIVLTGGVSKGAYDFVPDAAVQVGCETIFHRLSARPGQPTFAAVSGGKPVLGLPGNPLSVLCTARRLLVPALRRRAGIATPDPPPPSVIVQEWGPKSLPLTWWRPIVLTDAGVGRIAALMGSGDVYGPASTDGFIQAPPNSTGPGPYPFYAWRP